MEKKLLKRCLYIIDFLEINKLNLKSLTDQLKNELIQQEFKINDNEISECIQFCLKTNNLKTIEDGFDLSQPITVFAKSHDYSNNEALSLFECCLRVSHYKQQIVTLLKCTFNLSTLDEEPIFKLLLQLMSQTNLLIKIDQNNYSFNPEYNEKINWILMDYGDCVPILSECVRASFTDEIYKAKKAMEMRNQDYTMIDYKNKNKILSILPNKGIPVNRDESKDLQSFFKDCLFNEFNHCCALCGIHIPQMLIASHIKPFRDCAHVYEAMDNNNGLLLCRNHDYLFDQGYIAFEESGQIMICDELKNSVHYTAYTLNDNFKLKQSLMSDSRKKFLAEHKKDYYKV